MPPPGPHQRRKKDLRGRFDQFFTPDQFNLKLGYEVSAAETALRGTELYRDAMARGRPYDLVILDLTLPGGIGGKEALKRLIEIDPTVNAVVSSGYAMDATMSRSEDLGFRGVIAKPYEAAELGRTVREVIASSRVS